MGPESIINTFTSRKRSNIATHLCLCFSFLSLSSLSLSRSLLEEDDEWSPLDEPKDLATDDEPAEEYEEEDLPTCGARSDLYIE